MYNRIGVGITSHCQLNCPACTWGIGKLNYKDKQHATWEELENLAHHIYGINHITIIGGEPTMHPNFEEWSSKFRELFGCKELSVWSNGYGVKKFPEVFKNYDWLILTKFTSKSWEGCSDNTEDIDFIFNYYRSHYPTIQENWENGRYTLWKGNTKPLITSGEPVHVVVQKGTTNCGRSDGEFAIYLNNKLYPCCGEINAEGAVGIESYENWQEILPTLSLPCDTCIMGI